MNVYIRLIFEKSLKTICLFTVKLLDSIQITILKKKNENTFVFYFCTADMRYSTHS